jgi:hypothetical protein
MHETTTSGWRKSSYCGTTSCVEIANLASDDVFVRDSKNLEGSWLSFGPDSWKLFIAGVKDGEFDLQ